MTIVLADDVPLAPELDEWIRRMGWRLRREPGEGLELEWRQGYLSLCHRAKPFRPLFLDWPKLGTSLRIGKQDTFAKAIGVRLGIQRVVDATGGLGGDAVKLLRLGCQVTVIERSPVLFALLTDAKRRADQDQDWREKVSPRLVLRFGEAEDDFAEWRKNAAMRPQFDAIYLDPMFAIERSAAAGREMQMLDELLSADTNRRDQPVERLVAAALALQPRRVILKRPRAAEVTGDPRPTLSFSGKSVRYDVWSA